MPRYSLPTAPAHLEAIHAAERARRADLAPMVAAYLDGLISVDELAESASLAVLSNPVQEG